MAGGPRALRVLLSLERRGAQHGPIAVVGAAGWVRLWRRCRLSGVSGGVVLLVHPAAHPQAVGFGAVFGVGRMVRAGTVTRAGGRCRKTGGEGRNSNRGGGS